MSANKIYYVLHSVAFTSSKQFFFFHDKIVNNWNSTRDHKLQTLEWRVEIENNRKTITSTGTRPSAQQRWVLTIHRLQAIHRNWILISTLLSLEHQSIIIINRRWKNGCRYRSDVNRESQVSDVAVKFN